MSTAQIPDILSPEFAANPYPSYRSMRETAPLIWHEATQSWIVSRYADVERVFKDKDARFTTDKAIASIFANLLTHPQQLAAVRADRSLIPRAFAETLRFTPPVHMIMRQSAAAVELTGGTIPAGATVTCLIGAANRDEERYKDPDRFDIFRDDLTTTTAFSAAADHLAFALGRHFCVGALLARAEVETAVNQLLDAMSDMRLADGFDPVEEGVFTRGPQALPVRFTPVRA